MDMLRRSEKVNPGRQIEFDYLKFLTIIVMVITHVFEELSGREVTSLGGDGFQIALMYMANSLAAPSFMFAMGMGMVYGKNTDPASKFRRGLKLFFLGYALHIVRGTLPELFEYYVLPNFGHIRPDQPFTLYELMNVDILHFAGLTFMIFALFDKLQVRVPIMTLTAFVLQGIGALFSRIPIDSEIAEYILGLFIYENEGTCFPLTMWLVFPLCGYYFATLLIRVRNKKNFYTKLFLVDLALLFSYTASAWGSKVNLLTFFSLYEGLGYRQNAFGSMWTLMNIILWLSLCFFVSEIAHSQKADAVARFFGDQLSLIYILQWIVVGWIYMPTFAILGDEVLSYPGIVIYGIIIWGICSLVAFLITRKKYTRVSSAITPEDLQSR